MSKRFARLRSTLEKQNWKSLVSLFRRWPQDEERQTALDYAFAHIEDWPVHDCLAIKADNHPCWMLVKHWKLLKAHHEFMPLLKASPGLQKITCRAVDLSYYLGVLQECPNITDICLTGRMDLRNWQELQRLPHLRSIELADAQLPHLEGAGRWADLEVLSCEESTYLESLAPLADCKKLKRLVLNYAKLDTLEPLRELTCLEELRLDSCIKIDSLEPLRELTRLRILEIPTSKSLKTLEGLQHLSALEKINLNACSKLRSLQELASHTGLRELFGCFLKSLQSLEGLEAIESLEQVDLFYANVRSLQPLAHKTKLQHLRLQGVGPQIGAELELLQTMTGLVTLGLSDNQWLTSLPALKELSVLEELRLGETSLSSTEGLEGLTSLKKLMMKDCVHLEDLKGLDTLTALEKLDLHNCFRLSEYENIGALTALKELNLRGHRALQNTRVLSGLPVLRRLNLDFCTALQEVELDCPSLLELRVNNSTTMQSLAVSGCGKLEKLVATENPNLREITGLTDAKKLRELYIQSNPSLEEVEGWLELPKLKGFSGANCPKWEVQT